MPSDPPSDHTSLLSYPDIAREVGFLTMYCATLEEWLLSALSVFLRGNTEKALGIFSAVDNLTAKKDIVYNLAQLSGGLYPLATDLLAIKPKLDAAIAFRNAIAHGHFGAPLDGSGLDLVSNSISPRRGKPQTTRLSAKAIHVHVEALRETIAAIRKHAGQGFMGFVVPNDASPDTPPQASPEHMKPRRAHSVLRTRIPHLPSRE